MNDKNKTVDYEIIGELDENYWKPKSLSEWIELKRSSAIIDVWKEQQIQERKLRKTIGFWLFGLITFQVLLIFGLIFLESIKYIELNTTAIKILIPGALGEIFGMGYLVVKYLFSPSKTNINDILREHSED